MQLRLGLCDTHQRQSSQAVQSNRAPCEIRAKTCHTDEGTRVILVVTGKGRPDRPARIRAELMHWLERPDLRAHVASLRAAHPRHGGGGAFYVILRRAK